MNRHLTVCCVVFAVATAGCAWLVGVNDDPVLIGGSASPGEPSPENDAGARDASDGSSGALADQ